MNSRLITKLVKICLFGLMAIVAINFVSNFMQINLMKDYFENDIYTEQSYAILAYRNNIRVGFVNSFYLLLLCISPFVIGRWFYVSAKINHLLERRGLKIKPGWSVGWYFVPFANLVMPYLSLKETFKASFDRHDWQKYSVPYYFPLWWSTFIIGNALWNVFFRMVQFGLLVEGVEEYEYTEAITFSYIDMAADVLLIANAIFLLRIVKVISKNHEDVNFSLKLSQS